MSDARTTGFGVDGLALPRSWTAVTASRRPAAPAGPRYQLASWVALVGLVIPAWEAEVSVAGAKFTAGRLAVTVLVIPGVVILARRGRRLVACDMAVLLAAAWMLVAASATAGMGSLASPAAESLQFLFSYIVGRAFFFRPPALNTFIRVLKILTIAMILIAAAENIAGRWLAHEAAASIFGTTPLGAVFRGNTIRATSTLDHPILFGVFCALVNAILLLWERSAGRRLLFSVICLAGCVLSQSSAALMAYVLGVAAYVYDRQMRQTPARWTIFWVLFGGAIGAVFLVTEHPIGWLVSHLTLDPETGYYRMLIWDAALERIGQSPLTGYSFQLFNENILDSTVDCVWLVEALRFGIPASAFLFLANMAAIWPAGRRKAPSADEFDQRMNLAFAIVLLLFVFSGITVHFWNYMWIFWGLCIGIKASLRERAVSR